MGGSQGSSVDPNLSDHCPEEHKGRSSSSLAYLKLSLTEALNLVDTTVNNQMLKELFVQTQEKMLIKKPNLLFCLK